MARVFSIFVVVAIVLISCSKDQAIKPVPMPDGCREALFTFQSDILPILNLNCNFDECHGYGGKGSFDFTKYSVVASRVKAGTFEYRLDLPEDDPQHMPEEMKLNKCDYYTLKAWVSQGYPEN